MRWVLRQKLPDGGKGRQRDSEYYDAIYTKSDAYRVHYTKSPYYFLWCVIADRILSKGAKCVLDVGCGPGQFGAYIQEQGIERYVGLDFSAQSIKMARSPPLHQVSLHR